MEEEIKKFYGFYFMDGDHHKKKKSYITVISQVTIDVLLPAIAEIARYLPFKATHGTVMEFTVLGNEIRNDAASYVWREKIQAFVFKRYGEDVVDEGEGKYSINGVLVNMNFSQYEVHVIELS